MERRQICGVNYTTDGPSSSSMTSYNDSLSSSAYNNCVRPYKLDYTSFAVPIYGVIAPVCILLTVVTNCLVCAVLLRPNMRSPTNALLVAMAVSDTLTGLFPLPCFLYFYSAGRHSRPVPYAWCDVYFYLVDYLPTIFHTASVWLTMALAAVRYVCVCKPGRAAGCCGSRSVGGIIVAVYAVATVSQVSRTFEVVITPIVLDGDGVESRVGGATTESVVGVADIVVMCEVTRSLIVERYANIYFQVYYGFRVIFIHLVPCLFLIVMNAILIETMRSAQARRRQLQQQNRLTESRHVAKSSQRTLMLTIVVGVFLVVELPPTSLFIINIAENTFNIHLTDPAERHVASGLLNLFILLSYPINFFIYCSMSSKFRTTFKSMFKAKKKKKKRSGSTPAIAAVVDGFALRSLGRVLGPENCTTTKKRSGSAAAAVDETAIRGRGAARHDNCIMMHVPVADDIDRRNDIVGHDDDADGTKEESAEVKVVSSRSSQRTNVQGHRLCLLSELGLLQDEVMTVDDNVVRSVHKNGGVRCSSL